MSMLPWFRSAPQREERSARELLAEERLARAEAERDAAREQVADLRDRLTRQEAKHDALLAQILGRESSIAYPVTNPDAKQATTALERAISGMNTTSFSRAPKGTSTGQA